VRHGEPGGVRQAGRGPRREPWPQGRGAVDHPELREHRVRPEGPRRRAAGERPGLHAHQGAAPQQRLPGHHACGRPRRPRPQPHHRAQPRQRHRPGAVDQQAALAGRPGQRRAHARPGVPGGRAHGPVQGPEPGVGDAPRRRPGHRLRPGPRGPDRGGPPRRAHHRHRVLPGRPGGEGRGAAREGAHHQGQRRRRAAGARVRRLDLRHARRGRAEAPGAAQEGVVAVRGVHSQGRGRDLRREGKDGPRCASQR